MALATKISKAIAKLEKQDKKDLYSGVIAALAAEYDGVEDKADVKAAVKAIKADGKAIKAGNKYYASAFKASADAVYSKVKADEAFTATEAGDKAALKDIKANIKAVKAAEKAGLGDDYIAAVKASADANNAKVFAQLTKQLKKGAIEEADAVKLAVAVDGKDLSKAEVKAIVKDVKKHDLDAAVEKAEGAEEGETGGNEGGSKPGVPGETFTLTAGIDNLKGTAKDDVFIGGNGAGNTTGPADQLDGGAGNDTFKFYGGNITGTMPTLQNIENLYFNSTQGTLNAAAIAGVESVEIENATDVAGGGHTVTLSADQKLALTNINGTAANVATTVTGTAAGGITLDNVKVAVTGAAQTLNVDTTDASLNLTAKGGSSNIALNSTTPTALTKLNIDGDAKLTLDSNAAYTNLTKVDASKNTGGVNYTQAATTNLAFTGGTGDDRVAINTGDLLTANYKLDGGAGRDTLSIDTATLVGLTANAVTNVQNFEVLETRTSGTAIVLDASVFDAKNTWESLVVQNTGGAGGAHAVTVTNLAATAKDGIVVNQAATVNATTLTTTVKGFISGGTSDSATITVNANDTANVLNLNFDNVDVLNLVSKSANAANSNTINLAATADVEKVVVSGNVATTVTDTGAAGITEVDASGLVVANGVAAGLTFTQTGTQTLLVTGSNGRDTITVASAKGTVVANGGNDAITFSAAATALGDQSVNLSAKDFVAGGNVTVTFAAASANFAVLNFSSDIEALLQIGGVNLGSTTANQTVGAVINGQNNVALVGTALQFDLNGDGVFNAADDFQINLTGLTTSVTYDAANDWFILA